MEKGLDDILKNCIHVTNLREKGIVSELVLAINKYFLVPGGQFSSQKIVATYIEMFNILNEIDSKTVPQNGTGNSEQKMDHFKFTVFAF